MAFYARNKIPFVVGTTGGDREKLMQDARASNCYAVIAPQMGKQVYHTICFRQPLSCLGVGKTSVMDSCCSLHSSEFKDWHR